MDTINYKLVLRLHGRITEARGLVVRKIPDWVRPKDFKSWY